MYYSQEVTERIKLLTRKKGIGLGKMLLDCGLNTSTLNQMSEERGIASFSLGKIADCLDCSVDYLLCRTERVDSHKINKDDVIVNPNDEQLTEIIETYKQLNTIEKAKLLITIDKFFKKVKE